MSELYLKDTKVLTLKDIEGVPREIQKIDNPELLPLCLKNDCSVENFNIWLSKRCIPSTREGLPEIMEEFGTSWYECKNYASLTDQYWIKKRTETWKKINFFTNLYSKDIGDMFFMPWLVTKKRINNFSPDLTTNGVLKKRWIQNSDRSSALIKAGSEKTRQEPLSEVLVSMIAEQLGTIKSAGYDLYIEGTTMCSKCENFITADTELVPAYHIYLIQEKKKTETVYEHLIRMCDKFEIPKAKEFIDWMIFIDNLTGNEDRHLGNIGFIRDINTMKFIGPAPLFDCGSAYWSTGKTTSELKSKIFGNIEGKIFGNLKNKCDLESLFKADGYARIIENYPGITYTKKVYLINAISKRNRRLCISNLDFTR